MNFAEFETFDDAFLETLRKIETCGIECAPRAQKTKEVEALGFVLTNPRARRITIPERRWSEALAIGESAWHLAGSKDVNFISYYIKKWGEFSEDGRSIDGSCYGYRIFSTEKRNKSQWDSVLDLLREDPHTRRALLVLADPTSGASQRALDVPCISTIQFLIRDGRLDCLTYMRSNDAIWGACYDVYFVTLLQEIVACTLRLPLGKYVHFCGSMHVYERHFPLMKKILAKYPRGNVGGEAMPAMAEVESLPLFLRMEKALRMGRNVSDLELSKLGAFWRRLLQLLFDRRDRTGSERRSFSDV